MSHNKAGEQRKKRLKRCRRNKQRKIKQPFVSIKDTNDTNSIIYYGTRTNDLGQIEILGQSNDKYWCLVKKDDVWENMWLDENQIQNKGSQYDK